MVVPLDVEGLTKQFRQGRVIIEALRQVTLRVEQGQFVAVMGPSGSGKSTLLHLLAGLVPPDEGRILIEGHDLAGLSDYQRTVFRRRRIGLVFQAFNLVPNLTAEENILLPALADGTWPIDWKCSSADCNCRIGVGIDRIRSAAANSSG